MEALEQLCENLGVSEPSRLELACAPAAGSVIMPLAWLLSGNARVNVEEGDSTMGEGEGE